jgi:N-methylhydantoinase A/oxoprolinase/acetone carboxylase beta subunit
VSLVAELTLSSETVIAAFGGAGPMTICGAARRAGVQQVLVPRTAAVFSAFGIGFSELESERWLCRRCGHDLAAARGNYKEGTLVHDRGPARSTAP